MHAQFRLRLSDNGTVMMQVRPLAGIPEDDLLDEHPDEDNGIWWSIFGIDPEGYGVKYGFISHSGVQVDENDGTIQLL